MDPVELGKCLGRIERQGKATHELLKDHLNEPSCQECKLEAQLSTAQTNITWIKRIGAILVSAAAGILGLDKLFGGLK
jgi:hypothetical protein